LLTFIQVINNAVSHKAFFGDAAASGFGSNRNVKKKCGLTPHFTRYVR